MSTPGRRQAGGRRPYRARQVRAGDLERGRVEYRWAIALRPERTPAKYHLAPLEAAPSEEVSNVATPTEQG